MPEGQQRSNFYPAPSATDLRAFPPGGLADDGGPNPQSGVWHQIGGRSPITGPTLLARRIGDPNSAAGDPQCPKGSKNSPPCREVKTHAAQATLIRQQAILRARRAAKTVRHAVRLKRTPRRRSNFAQAIPRARMAATAVVPMPWRLNRPPPTPSIKISCIQLYFTLINYRF